MGLKYQRQHGAAVAVDGGETAAALSNLCLPRTTLRGQCRIVARERCDQADPLRNPRQAPFVNGIPAQRRLAGPNAYPLFEQIVHTCVSTWPLLSAAQMICHLCPRTDRSQALMTKIMRRVSRAAEVPRNAGMHIDEGKGGRYRLSRQPHVVYLW